MYYCKITPSLHFPLGLTKLKVLIKTAIQPFYSQLIQKPSQLDDILSTP